MTKEISMSNTKKEILDAYNEILEDIKTKKSEDPRAEKEQKAKTEIVVNASDNTFDGIVKNIAALKLNLTKSLEKLGDELSSEFKKLTDIKQAITIEDENLKNVYQISTETDTLAAMIQAQKEKKEIFEEEISEKSKTFESERNEQKESWQKEKESYLSKLKEEKTEKEKTRKREEEEYKYNLMIERKKETDVYDENKEKQEKELSDKKTAFEKEIKERETAVAQNEAELTELRKRNEKFPSEIEKTIKETEKQITDKLNNEFDFKNQLSTKETEGDLKLKEQVIENLQAKIKDLDSQIKILSGKADKAESNAKDIVLKAIESSGSKQVIVERPKEKIDKE